MELEKPVGDKVGCLMPAVDADQGQGNRPIRLQQGQTARPNREEKCYVTGRDKRMLKHDCDVTFGDYGSPIFVRDGKKIGVGALHVAVGIAIFLSRGGVK